MHLPLRSGLALAATLVIGCGIPSDETVADPSRQPIIGGADSKDGEFPTVVGLLLDAYAPDLMNPTMPLKCIRGQGVCTATLIREDVVLTAAHCVTNLLKGAQGIDCPNDPDPPRYTLEANLIAAARGGRLVQTEKVVVHPKFGPTMCKNPPDVDEWNDIALVFLQKPLTGMAVQRIPRPEEAGALLKEGSKVRIVGYGKSRVDDSMGMTAGVQRHGTATLERVGTSEIRVAKLGEQQACQGDSGGPVFANPDAPFAQQVQIGVASRLRTLRCPGLLDILFPPKCENGVFYTRVDAYAQWIWDTIKQVRPNPPDPPKPDPKPEPEPEPEPGMPPGPDQPKAEDSGCSCSTARDRGGPAALPFLAAVLGLLAAWRRSLRRRSTDSVSLPGPPGAA